MSYYHLTPISNKESILKNGLLSNIDMQIFLFTNLSVASTIAVNQIFIFQKEKFVVFEIDPKGINTDILADNVAESTAMYQFYIHQKIIQPQFIKLLYEAEILSTLRPQSTQDMARI
ncbi:MAG: hypothetical protein SNJ35_08360 [Rikenellaceae bacterium]